MGVSDSADQLDHRVQILDRFLESEQDMLALARLAQQKVGAAPHHFDAVIDEPLQNVHQAEFARLPVHDGQHDHAEVHLQLRVLVEIVQNHFGLLAALQLEHDPHPVAVALIANFGNPLDLLLVHQARRLLQ